MFCKICNTLTEAISDISLKKTYHFCHTCDAIALDSSDYLLPAKEHALYNNHHNSLENEGYVAMFENFLDFFWDNLTCKEESLDFGSGPTPVLSYLLERRGVRVDCYDKFYQPKPCYENKLYDFITSTEVFEHLENPLETLQLLSSHLKPHGTLALMTLFHSNDKAHFLQWWYRRDPTHIIFYTPKTLEMMAEKCGLCVLKTDNKRIMILKKK